jgi:hypothetical protein
MAFFIFLFTLPSKRPKEEKSVLSCYTLSLGHLLLYRAWWKKDTFVSYCLMV